MQKLVIIGGGFAGFWSAVSAVRQARELNKAEELKVVLISKDEYHTIRPRLYEPVLEGTRVSLHQYCEPLNIDLVCGEVTGIDPINKNVSVSNSSEKITYDYLILAAGSRLKRSHIPGFEKAFNVDTYEAASTLDLHLMPPVLVRFRRAGTPFDVRKAASALITDGPYRFSRNPSYVSLTMLYVGLGVVLNSVWILLLAVPVLLIMDLWVIRREEKYLEEKFGKHYLQYKSTVRRWL